MASAPRDLDLLQGDGRAVDAIGLATVVTDVTGRVLAWNRAAEDLYGWSRDEAVGRDVALLLPCRPAPGGRRVEGYRDATSASSAELLIRTRSGDEVHVEVRTRPLAGPGGPLLGTVGVSIDLTGRERDARRLADLEAYQRSYFSASPVPQLWVTLSGAVAGVNHAMCRLLGYDEEAIVGRPVLELSHPGDEERLRSTLARLSSGESECWRVEMRCTHRDGSPVWVEVLPSLVRDSEGFPSHVVAMVIDVRDRRRAQEELLADERQTRELLALAEAIQAAAPVAWGVIDLDFRVVRVNDTMARLDGVDPEEVRGGRVEEVLPQRHPYLADRCRRVLESGSPCVAVEVMNRGGSAGAGFWLSTYYPVMVGGELVAIGVVGVDISETKRAEAFRSVVMDTMAEGLYAVDRAGRVTFANRAAARILGWSPDELLGRDSHQTFHFQRGDGSVYPRDECPLLRVWEQNRTVRVTDEVFIRKDGSAVPVAFSAAPLAADGETHGVVVVFRDASVERDEALRARRAIEELSWVGRIRDAMDEGRLVLYSQPIVSFREGVPDAEELLLRMVATDGEVVLPGMFLPIAEKYGLIGDIDRWVIREAAGLAAQGRRVEVNISASTVGHPEIVDHIRAELERVGADPGLLVFEITETSLIHDADAGEEFAMALTELGCSVALDDFGTGFGSFTYLKRLPVSYLKIDQEFVRDLASSEANQHVVKAIVSLAAAFGQRTVAEGVETAEVLELLRRFGVDLAQGHLLGRPVPAVGDAAPVLDE